MVFVFSCDTELYVFISALSEMQKDLQGKRLRGSCKIRGKNYQRDCEGKVPRDGELTPGQGLYLTGAFQRRGWLPPSCWGCKAGDADRSRAAGEWGIMHHLPDARPVRSRHGTRDTGINDDLNCLGYAWDMHFSSSGSGVWKINVIPLQVLAQITKPAAA